LAMVWTEMQTPRGGDDIAMFSRMPTDNSTSPSGLTRRFNLVTKGRPFWHAGYPYSACSTSVAVETIRELAQGILDANGLWNPVTGGLGNIFECEVLMRWAPGVNDSAWVAGAYNVGYAQSLQLDHGNCNTVWR